MSSTKFKNFSYLKGPKGDKGDKGEPGSAIVSTSGRILYNATTKIVGFNETGLATQTYVNSAINNLEAATTQYVDVATSSIVGEQIIFEGDYSINGTLINSFHPVAISGNYNSLENKPDIPTALSQLSNDSNFISNVDWIDIQHKPAFADVATTGNYSNLLNKPVIPGDLAELTDITGIISNLKPGSYNDLTDKPNVIDINLLKSIVATSIDFQDFKTKILDL
jgi:hypothetical protein